MLEEIASDPRILPALIALIAALTALLRAETARQDARTAISRTGGRRRTPPSASHPAPGQQDRRKPQ